MPTGIRLAKQTLSMPPLASRLTLLILRWAQSLNSALRGNGNLFHFRRRTELQLLLTRSYRQHISQFATSSTLWRGAPSTWTLITKPQGGSFLHLGRASLWNITAASLPVHPVWTPPHLCPDCSTQCSINTSLRQDSMGLSSPMCLLTSRAYPMCMSVAIATNHLWRVLIKVPIGSSIELTNTSQQKSRGKATEISDDRLKPAKLETPSPSTNSNFATASSGPVPPRTRGLAIQQPCTGNYARHTLRTCHYLPIGTLTSSTGTLFCAGSFVAKDLRHCGDPSSQIQILRHRQNLARITDRSPDRVTEKQKKKKLKILII